MDLVSFGALCRNAGYTEIDKNHFFFVIFKEEKLKEHTAYFMKERKRFLNVLFLEHPFDIENVKLFEIPLVEIQNAKKQKFSMPLHIPPDKGYLPNHEGEEVVGILKAEG